MNDSKVYQFNEYVLAYDKSQNDISCLTIGKIQNGNLYVMSSLYDESADVISMMLDSSHEEIKRLNNIILQTKSSLKDRIKSVPETMAEVYEDEFILNQLNEFEEGKSK